LLQGYYPAPDADSGRSSGSSGSGGYSRTGYSDESDFYDDNESNVYRAPSSSQDDGYIRPQGQSNGSNFNRPAQSNGSNSNRPSGQSIGSGANFNRPSGQNNGSNFNRPNGQNNVTNINRQRGQNNGSSYNRQGQPGPVNGERPRAMRPGTTSGDSRFVTNSSRDLEAGRPPSAADNSFEKLSIGDSVMHTKFGTGKVVKVIGENDKQIYDVQFEGEAGKRLLDPKFAKLIKLS
jgi:hypothetical protein